jgi:glycosyltransferase involved in cell wall biosynthesis
LRPDIDVLVAEQPEAFADAVARLVSDQELWTRLSANGLSNVSRYFSREAAAATLRRVLD